MGSEQILLVMAALLFVAGMLMGSAISLPHGADMASPFKAFFGISPEKPSPQNWITEDAIKVFDDRVVIYIDDPYWSKFTNTNSMDPLLDEHANAIQIKPTSPSQIEVGDVISYRSPLGAIIHRVVEIGLDEQGWYAIVKGDNNAYEDPDRVRFEQVERVLVAVIY